MYSGADDEFGCRGLASGAGAGSVAVEGSDDHTGDVGGFENEFAVAGFVFNNVEGVFFAFDRSKQEGSGVFGIVFFLFCRVGYKGGCFGVDKFIDGVKYKLSVGVRGNFAGFELFSDVLNCVVVFAYEGDNAGVVSLFAAEDGVLPFKHTFFNVVVVFLSRNRIGKTELLVVAYAVNAALFPRNTNFVNGLVLVVVSYCSRIPVVGAECFAAAEFRPVDLVGSAVVEDGNAGFKIVAAPLCGLIVGNARFGSAAGKDELNAGILPHLAEAAVFAGVISDSNGKTGVYRGVDNPSHIKVVFVPACVKIESPIAVFVVFEDDLIIAGTGFVGIKRVSGAVFVFGYNAVLLRSLFGVDVSDVDTLVDRSGRCGYHKDRYEHCCCEKKCDEFLHFGISF